MTLAKQVVTEVIRRETGDRRIRLLYLGWSACAWSMGIDCRGRAYYAKAPTLRQLVGAIALQVTR